MILTINTVEKTVIVDGQYTVCEIAKQLKTMFPETYKEFKLIPKVEYSPYQPFSIPTVPCDWQPYIYEPTTIGQPINTLPIITCFPISSNT